MLCVLCVAPTTVPSLPPAANLLLPTEAGWDAAAWSGSSDKDLNHWLKKHLAEAHATANCFTLMGAPIKKVRVADSEAVGCVFLSHSCCVCCECLPSSTPCSSGSTNLLTPHSRCRPPPNTTCPQQTQDAVLTHWGNLPNFFNEGEGDRPIKSKSQLDKVLQQLGKKGGQVGGTGLCLDGKSRWQQKHMSVSAHTLQEGGWRHGSGAACSSVLASPLQHPCLCMGSTSRWALWVEGNTLPPCLCLCVVGPLICPASPS